LAISADRQAGVSRWLGRSLGGFWSLWGGGAFGGFGGLRSLWGCGSLWGCRGFWGFGSLTTALTRAEPGLASSAAVIGAGPAPKKLGAASAEGRAGAGGRVAAHAVGGDGQFGGGRLRGWFRGGLGRGLSGRGARRLRRLRGGGWLGGWSRSIAAAAKIRLALRNLRTEDVAVTAKSELTAAKVVGARGSTAAGTALGSSLSLRKSHVVFLQLTFGEQVVSCEEAGAVVDRDGRDGGEAQGGHGGQRERSPPHCCGSF